MSFRRQLPPRVRPASRTRLGLFLLAAVGLVLGLLSSMPAASAATTSHAKTAARTGTSAPAKPASTATAAKTARVCATPKKGQLECLSLRRTDVVEPKALRSAKKNAVTPDATPAGYGPSSLISAYKLSTSGGAGQTVAIVDAYNYPTAAADLATYRSQYGLPACTTASGCFKVVNQNGAASPLPTSAGSTGWDVEEALDIDMVSAACPNCHILLVEANSPSNADLGAAENAAVSAGAKFVSNSYGGSESSSDTTYDAQYYNHPGVAITVSSGDDGYGTEYPAASQYVTAVGGTTLTSASNTRGWTETAWSDAGSGCSTIDAKPSWQTVTTGCAKRAVADVSADADPNTGLAVYNSYSAGGWEEVGGTSASSPFVAGVYALAGTPTTGSYPASYPYSHQSSLFDITSGSNGSCSPAELCKAGTGWDGPTGLGSPNGSAAFGAGAAGNTVTVTNPGNQTAKLGTAFSLQISASDSGGTALTYTATGLPAGLSINSSTGLISGTPTAATTASVVVTAKDATGATGSASFTITVSTTGSGCTSAQLLGNPGFESGNTVWAASSGVIGPNGPSEPAHAGTYDAWMDGYGTTHTDTLTQSVTIPAACTHSTLTFYLHIDTAETTTTTQFDKLTVKAGSTTLGTFSNLNHNTGYAAESFSVGSLAGQTVSISFSATEDSSLQTSFVVDDTAVTTS